MVSKDAKGGGGVKWLLFAVLSIVVSASVGNALDTYWINAEYLAKIGKETGRVFPALPAALAAGNSKIRGYVLAGSTVDSADPNLYKMVDNLFVSLQIQKKATYFRVVEHCAKISNCRKISEFWAVLEESSPELDAAIRVNSETTCALTEIDNKNFNICETTVKNGYGVTNLVYRVDVEVSYIDWYTRLFGQGNFRYIGGLSVNLIDGTHSGTLII